VRIGGSLFAGASGLWEGNLRLFAKDQTVYSCNVVLWVSKVAIREILEAASEDSTFFG
jgi:hypothetical protein